jgi:hypothetical protein
MFFGEEIEEQYIGENMKDNKISQKRLTFILDFIFFVLFS